MRYLLLIILCFNLQSIFSQENAWFYIRATDTLFNPEFVENDGELIYNGSDTTLKSVFEDHKVFKFKKTYRKAKRKNLKKTFFVISEDESLLTDLLNKTPHLFDFGELIAAQDKQIFEPNDYGLTSTIADNKGLPLYLDYYDFLKVPEAWYYTTGSRDIIVGISDGSIDPIDKEFAGKTKIIRESRLAKGHGISVAATAAGQGNNGYGFTGVCSDCSIYGTTYGQTPNLDILMELSRAGVKVINCSWGSSMYYATAQEAVNEMLANGTVIVAIGHNKSWHKSRGKILYYPASYDNVISVSSGMHRYDEVSGNIEYLDGLPYAKNIKGYVGRTVGFKDHDTTKTHRIYLASVRNLNPKVDILGPATGIMRYSEYALHGEIDYSITSQTSGVAPLVTGTVGLMFSLYPCLPADEVESILKMTSINLDDIHANKPYLGNFGSGMLQTGPAVKMVYQLYSEKETAFIENQKFSRWGFKLTSLSEAIVIRNQKFTDSSSLKLTAKNQIIISENTTLKPDSKGYISLIIDRDLVKECDLVLRDPSIENKVD